VENLRLAPPGKQHRLLVTDRAKISAAAKAHWARERKTQPKTAKPKRLVEKIPSRDKPSKTMLPLLL
jgi:hypothetical protein